MSLSPNLPRRAIACPGWEWLPGMRAINAGHPTGTVYRVTAVDDNGSPCGVEDGAVCCPRTWGLDGLDGLGSMDPSEWLPDLTDDATLGAVLKLVRLAWDNQAIWAHADRKAQHWWVDSFTGPSPATCGIWATEAEALVVALERAPLAP